MGDGGWTPLRGAHHFDRLLASRQPPHRPQAGTIAHPPTPSSSVRLAQRRGDAEGWRKVAMASPLHHPPSHPTRKGEVRPLRPNGRGNDLSGDSGFVVAKTPSLGASPSFAPSLPSRPSRRSGSPPETPPSTPSLCVLAPLREPCLQGHAERRLSRLRPPPPIAPPPARIRGNRPQRRNTPDTAGTRRHERGKTRTNNPSFFRVLKFSCLRVPLTRWADDSKTTRGPDLFGSAPQWPRRRKTKPTIWAPLLPQPPRAEGAPASSSARAARK